MARHAVCPSCGSDAGCSKTTRETTITRSEFVFDDQMDDGVRDIGDDNIKIELNQEDYICDTCDADFSEVNWQDEDDPPGKKEDEETTVPASNQEKGVVIYPDGTKETIDWVSSEVYRILGPRYWYICLTGKQREKDMIISYHNHGERNPVATQYLAMYRETAKEVSGRMIPNVINGPVCFYEKEG